MSFDRQLSEKVFGALDIKNVVWIDDEFSDIDRAQNNDFDRLHRAAIHLLEHANVKPLSKVGLLPEKYFGAPFDVQLRVIEANLASNSFDARKIGTVPELRAVAFPDPGDEGEIDDNQFDVIAKFLDQAVDEFHKCSFEEWEKSKEDITLDERSLVLLDLNAEREGKSDRYGVDVLLSYVLGHFEIEKSPNFVILTHECSDSRGEEALHKEVHKAVLEGGGSISPGYFQVMGKNRLSSGEGDTVDQLLLSLRALLTRRVSSIIADCLAKELSEAISEAKDALLGQSIYALDKVVFDSSLQEGCSEIETFYRVVNLSQRNAIYDTVKKNRSLLGFVQKVRRLSSDKSNEQFKERLEDEMLDHFYELRRGEVFADSKYLNGICDPLAPGDIFQFRIDRGRKAPKFYDYVLISQACDTLLRSDSGLRKANIGVFLPLKEKDVNEENEIELRGKVFHTVFTDKKRSVFQYVELNSGQHVSLNVLDWCSFNDQGRVEISDKQKPSPFMYLDGHLKLFDTLKMEFSKRIAGEPNRFPAFFNVDGITLKRPGGFSLPIEINILENESGDYTASLPIQRIGRVGGVHFEHLLRSYFSFRSRQAFEYDFV